jgi:hypothetical protein
VSFAERSEVEKALSNRQSSRARVIHRSCFAMNTRFSMVLVGMDDQKAEMFAAAAERDLRAYEPFRSGQPRIAPESLRA